MEEVQKEEKRKEKIKVGGWKILFILLFSCFAFLPQATRAATLYLAPSTGTLAQGATFTSRVQLSSEDQPMNAASGIVTFPTAQLEVVSVSKAGSIFSLWAREPAFSNTAGTVSFEGIVLNPGFTGKGATVLTITFRARAEGSAGVKIASPIVLANDGAATSILKGAGSATYTVTQKAAPDAPKPSTVPPTTTQPTPTPEPAPTPDGDTPDAPVVSSPTHADQDAWSNQNTVTMQWIVPDGVTGVRTLFTKDSAAEPSVNRAVEANTQTVKNLDDGQWYFVIQFKNDAGWGAVTRRSFKIDTTPPHAFTIATVPSEKGTTTLRYNTTDDHSGISHYEVTFGAFGARITAYDFAGNSRSASTVFDGEIFSTPWFSVTPKTLAYLLGFAILIVTLPLWKRLGPPVARVIISALDFMITVASALAAALSAFKSTFKKNAKGSIDKRQPPFR